ncbi:MAG: sugar phosphate isomerase/epimerase [Clostridiales bacterium]|nr:sugar phosphate isomerase/epimerase [Clostridiales bacterium]
MRFPISLASYSFHAMRAQKTIDVFGYLEATASRYRNGYADIWSGMLDSIEPAYIATVRREMDRRDLKLANLCVDGPCLWADDADRREANRKDMLAYIECANALGAATIRIDFGGRTGEMTEQGFDYIVARYREYCDRCHDLGMKIGPENHWGWDKRFENLKKVQDAVDHPAYGLLLHLNYQDYDDFDRQCQPVLSSVMHAHVPANSIAFVKDMLRQLGNAGYAGALSVEHHSGAHELERVEWQLGALRCLLAELADEDSAQPARPDYFHTDVYYR